MTSPLQQKMKIAGPVVVTANRLGDGAVTTAREATELLAAATADDTAAVGVYVAPVCFAADGRPQPGNLRESIRHAGPTVASTVTLGN
jgi:hypothetical protein